MVRSRDIRSACLLAGLLLAGLSPAWGQEERRPGRPLDLSAEIARQFRPPNRPVLTTGQISSQGSARPAQPARPAPPPPVLRPPVTAAAAEPPRPQPQAVKPAETVLPPPSADTDAAQFCSNITDAAADARLAWQLKEIQNAEGRLRERIAELEAKRAEYEHWLRLRDEFLKKAERNVVDIYSRMKPDAAAVQLASMGDDTAAALLAQLAPRNSSAILNEMEPARAAHLANTLAGMRRTTEGKSAK